MYQIEILKWYIHFCRSEHIFIPRIPHEAMVNDGGGGFRGCSSWQEVLDYGASRVGRVKRKFREDKLDPKPGKMKGGTVTTSLLVSHLPKSMCVEVPDFYPVVDKSTGDPVLDTEGVPLKRSRWVAHDRDGARRYFEDVVAYLGDNVIPGGVDAILGYDIQHSQSTPHVQIVADTFAPDPKNEGDLRVESSQAWFSQPRALRTGSRPKSTALASSEAILQRKHLPPIWLVRVSTRSVIRNLASR